MSIFLVVFMYGLWSTVFSLGKMALDHSPPLFLTASRMLLASALLLGYLFFWKKASFRLSSKQWVSLVLLSCFSIYLTNALEFWSLQHLSAAKTCFIYSLSPFFAALLSYLHFGETINKTKWLGMGIGFLGFLPVLAIQKGSEDLLTSISFLSWPELAMMGAAFCTSYGWVLLRKIVNPSSGEAPISPLMANGMSMWIGGTFALLHSLWQDSWTPTPIEPGGEIPFLQGILIITAISNIVCYNLYGFLLKKFTATFLSFMGLLSPIFASLSSWIFLGETPSPILLGATGVVGFGLWLIYSAELRQGYVQTPSISSTSKT